MDLIKWEKIKSDIATIKDIQELSRQSYGLDAIQKWGKQSGQSLETQNEIAEYRIRLDRRRGQWIEANIPKDGARGTGVNQHRGAAKNSYSSPTLKDAGIGHNESPKLRALAQVPNENIETFIFSTKDKNKELSLKSALQLANKIKREKARVENARIVETNIVEKPKLNHYQTIAIDPPWDISEQGDNEPFARSEPTYASMTVKQITDENIGQYAQDNCHLYLWGINRMIFRPQKIISSWGFRYVTMLTWCKPSIGMGNYYRNNTEHIFFCVRGSLPLLRHDVGTWFEAKRGDRGHSSKPDEFYELIETCSPGPRLDYFARDERKGWDVYGGEL